MKKYRIYVINGIPAFYNRIIECTGMVESTNGYYRFYKDSGGSAASKTIALYPIIHTIVELIEE